MIVPPRVNGLALHQAPHPIQLRLPGRQHGAIRVAMVGMSVWITVSAPLWSGTTGRVPHRKLVQCRPWQERGPAHHLCHRGAWLPGDEGEFFVDLFSDWTKVRAWRHYVPIRELDI